MWVQITTKQWAGLKVQAEGILHADKQGKIQLQHNTPKGPSDKDEMPAQVVQ